MALVSMSKLKYIWATLVAIVLAINIISYVADPNGDATGNVMFLVGALGFPLSVVPTLGVLTLVGSIVPNASSPYVFTSICVSYVVFGFVQWFWVVPAITEHFRKASHKKIKEDAA